MQLTITNLTSAPVYIRELYTSVQPGTPIVLQRTAAQIEAMDGLMAAVVALSVSISVAQSTLETQSGVNQAVDAASPDKLASYSNATRPASTTYPVSGAIWNTDDTAPNFADGANWRDATGAVT